MPKATNKDQSTLAPGLERLERAIAHMGLASRREAKDLISKGLVRVNKKVVKEPGFGIRLHNDVIEIEGTSIPTKESVLVYKPRAIETNKTSAGIKDLHEYFPKLQHLHPIGRLDKDSEGLIIMSNDGSLARALTQENSEVGKTYEVTVRENITDEALRKMTNGIMLSGSSSFVSSKLSKVGANTPARRSKTKPAQVQRLSRTVFSIVLHEGRKHQIRRMCDACHLTVESLIRTNIGHLSIEGMKPGSTRKLITDDIELLKK